MVLPVEEREDSGSPLEEPAVPELQLPQTWPTLEALGSDLDRLSRGDPTRRYTLNEVRALLGFLPSQNPSIPLAALAPVASSVSRREVGASMPQEPTFGPNRGPEDFARGASSSSAGPAPPNEDRDGTLGRRRNVPYTSRLEELPEDLFFDAAAWTAAPGNKVYCGVCEAELTPGGMFRGRKRCKRCHLWETLHGPLEQCSNCLTEFSRGNFHACLCFSCEHPNFHCASCRNFCLGRTDDLELCWECTTINQADCRVCGNTVYDRDVELAKGT